MEKVTYEEYVAAIAKLLNTTCSVYISGTIKAYGDIAEAIDAIEEAHPEYEERLCNDTI